jgi:hypothetical protein
LNSIYKPPCSCKVRIELMADKTLFRAPHTALNSRADCRTLAWERKQTLLLQNHLTIERTDMILSSRPALR